MDAEKRKRFAASAAETAEEYGLDGIDIDWEYPCSSVAGIGSSPDDKENFTALLSSLRDALPKGRSLSIAAGAGADFIEHKQMDKVAQLLDYVQLMTYDMRGFDEYSGHHTGLFATPGDPNPNTTQNSVRLMLEAGVPRSKLVIGSAFYCRSFKGVAGADKCPVQKCSGVADIPSGGYGTLKREYINKAGFKRYWDSDAKAPYLYNGDIMLSYDDPESIRHKCEYIRENELSGIMYWAHGPECDDLVETMYDNLA